jgi:hypothetical protein
MKKIQDANTMINVDNDGYDHDSEPDMREAEESMNNAISNKEHNAQECEMRRLQIEG